MGIQYEMACALARAEVKLQKLALIHTELRLNHDFNVMPNKQEIKLATSQMTPVNLQLICLHGISLRHYLLFD